MEAKELMIFDLVECNKIPTRIMHSGHMDSVENYPNKYKPIKITKKILEDNGFDYVEEKNGGIDFIAGSKYYIFADYTCEVKIWKTEGCWSCHAENDSEEEIFKRIKSVHELQHIFNILEIKKEINV